MKNYDLLPIVKCCDLAFQLFSDDPDIVAETIFLGQYRGPNDVDIIRRTIVELDKTVGPSLEEKIEEWTLDKVNIADLLKLNLTDNQICLLVLRLENARLNIPQLLGSEEGRPTYELLIHAAAESFAVLWALTAFWSLTRDAFADCEARYLSDVIASREYPTS